MDASEAIDATKKLVLDDFMDGMIFELFEAKWHKFAKQVHHGVLTFADSLLIAS